MEGDGKGALSPLLCQCCCHVVMVHRRSSSEVGVVVIVIGMRGREGRRQREMARVHCHVDVIVMLLGRIATSSL